MTRKSRILWLTPDKPKNISVGRQRIAAHLRKRGFDITLRGTTGRTVVRSLREFGQYDAIMGTTRAGALAGMVLSSAHRRPLVVDHVDPIRQFEETHPYWLSVVVRNLENAAFTTADNVLYVYDEEYERIERHASRTKRTALGVEFERFSEPDPNVVDAARTKLDTLGLDGRIAIYVGGLEPIYHVRDLVEGVELLDNWSLVILGDGSLSEEIQALDAEKDTVAYLGTVPHESVPGYLHCADVGISLVDDPHTLKVLEYGAAGLPVVQRRGRAESRFGDRVVYADATPESIAAAIERAGKQESDNRLRSFAAGFDWAEIADDYEQSLKSVI